MNFIEYYKPLKEAKEALSINSVYVSNAGDKPYKYNHLTKFRNKMELIEHIDLLAHDVAELKSSALYSTSLDYIQVSNSDNSKISTTLYDIEIKVDLMLDIISASNLTSKEDLVYIKLPEFKSFDDLAKYSKDLQKAIELPITDEAIGGEVNIIGADQGSVILYVALGSLAAVKLIAGICWSAAVIRKKHAEANIFIQHAKTLELKNEALDSLVNAQQQQLKNIADAEATALANGLLNHNDPETIGRLRLSMEIISNLIDKGGKILPMTKDEDVQKAFPNYNALDLIESSIRQIKSGV